MAVNLTTIERTWYEIKTGLDGTIPLNDLKKRYWAVRTGSSTRFFNQLEIEWLRYELAQDGKTPSGKSANSLWLQVGGRKNVNDAKINFYSTH